ncbi:hypothetical protein EFK50_00925 [Nocardioides marmoriginsengisoli]|uniref:Serine protease n=1 Tax=Nocardioides marmoriginsengisoli TaxID=661483 RepID=A0A3N0CS77_9ACTN|nr:trypsin-like peptidase domain-containing protein [Nocardioides marmoriginsengisoli]RNL66219.1 hypothetical protein EFK50_00925 [Nocardioides marmoriginsengisoli]
MPALPKRLLAVLLGLVTAAVVLVPAASTQAARAWAPESTAVIKPGVQMLTAGAQCTANFVFRDAAGNVYVGYAAHCAGKGKSDDVNGCTTPSLPMGTAVQFVTGGNFFRPGKVVGTGRLAYSSWASMQKLRTKDANRCALNDFALVRVDRASVAKVNPTMPVWGGPSRIVSGTLATGSAIYTVGNSSMRTGKAVAKTGKILGSAGGGLGYHIRTGNPGIPGDSGSGFLDAQGRAAGVLSTLNIGISLMPVTNTMGNLGAELAWAQRYAGIKGLVLVPGTRPFKR